MQKLKAQDLRKTNTFVQVKARNAGMAKKMRFSGFTLLELMFALAIVAILTTIAVGSYSEHVKKAKRTDGQVALLQLAGNMERYYTQNNTYAGATLANVGSSATSPQGKYNLSITSASATTFQITATPTFSDSSCGNLTYNQLGQKGASGSAGVSECW